MQRTLKHDAAPGVGRIVTVTDRIYILLDGVSETAVVLPLEETCPACGAQIKAWELPSALASTAVACGCLTAVIRPHWTPETIVEHWKALIQVRGQCERKTSDPRMN
jgi:hypothetical protein